MHTYYRIINHASQYTGDRNLKHNNSGIDSSVDNRMSQTQMLRYECEWHSGDV